MDRFRSFLGLLILLAVAWALCPRGLRRRVNWRCVAAGVGLQLVLAVMVLKAPWAEAFFRACNDLVVALLDHAAEGARFVFGALAKPDVLGQAFGPADAVSFAFQSLIPVIIFFSALMAIGYQLGIMQRLVALVARVVVRLMGTSGAETLAAVGNVFLGMVEAPLMIRPYLARLTRSELFCVMVGGMANVAGTVLAVYVGFLRDYLPTIAGHLITMSVMSAPAGLAIAKLMLPEDGEPETRGEVKVEPEKLYGNVIDAITGGAMDGLRVAGSVVALLIAMIALVDLANGVIGYPATAHNARILAQATPAASPPAKPVDPADRAAVQAAAEAAGVAARAWEPLTFQRVAGWGFQPLAWCLGVPLQDVPLVGRLLGEKTVLNEFIAYLDMAQALQENPHALTERGRLLASYALCGFANFGSVAIMIGGLGAMVPSRRRELAELGILSLVGGTLASSMTACVVGLLT